MSLKVRAEPKGAEDQPKGTQPKALGVDFFTANDTPMKLEGFLGGTSVQGLEKARSNIQSSIQRYRIECVEILNQLEAELKALPSGSDEPGQTEQGVKRKTGEQRQQIEQQKKVCQQLLREMDKWEQAVMNPQNLPFKAFQEATLATCVLMNDDLDKAHPRFINLYNRAHLEANGWLEFKVMMNESKKLSKLLGFSAQKGLSGKWWQVVMNKEQKASHTQLMEAAKNFNLQTSYLMDLTEVEEVQERKPFSLEWFNRHSQEIAQKSEYLVRSTETNTWGLTEAGRLRAERILEEALNPDPNSVAMPRQLKQRDLVLLAHYLGRENMQHFTQLYALYGDGSPEHPFNMDNLRAVLIGMAANRKAQIEAPEIKVLLDKVTEQCCNTHVNMGSSYRMLQAFNNRAQNTLPELPDSKVSKWNLLYAFRRWAREYSYKVVDSSPERYAAAQLLSMNIPMHLVVTTVFTLMVHTKMRNDPAREYMNDLAAVKAQQSLTERETAAAKMNTGESAAKKILNDLKNSQSYEDFCDLYPMFNKENAHKAEYEAIEAYFKAGKGQDGPIASKAEEVITRKVMDIDRLTRAERLSHDLAYKNIAGKENLVLHLPDRNGNLMRFQGRNIIPPETGLGVNFFSPASGQPIHDDLIPLIIVFPGTHNQMGLLRDLETRSPGQAQWSASSEKRQKIIDALNAEMGRLKKIYPNAKFSIECMGHSLGGSDALQMELLIMEAMAQNMPEAKVNEYRSKIDQVFTEEDQETLDQLQSTKKPNPEQIKTIEELIHKKEIQQQLLIGLNSALNAHGTKRTYDTTDAAEDRSIPEQSRTHITEDNIAVLSTFCNRGAGASKENTAASCALMGLLDKTQINEDCLDVEGDPLRVVGASPFFGATLVDTRLAPFSGRENLHLNAITLKTEIGFRKQGWAYNAFAANEIAPVTGHVGSVFRGDAYGSDVRFRSSENQEEYADYKKELTGSLIKAKSIRSFKWSLYVFLVYLVRIPTEFLVRRPIVQGIPALISTVFGSNKYAATYQGRTEKLRIQREKANIVKQAFINKEQSEGRIGHKEKHIKRKELKKKERGVLSRAMESVPHAERYADFLPVGSITNITTYDKLLLSKHVNTGNLMELHALDDEALVDHLKHQLTKGKKYLADWEQKLKTLQEQQEINRCKAEEAGEDAEFFRDESLRLAEEITRLEQEIKSHREFVSLLSDCFAKTSDSGLDGAGCKAFMDKVIENQKNLESTLEQRNVKTLSLETKSAMPLMMLMQKKEIDAVNTQIEKEKQELIEEKRALKGSKALPKEEYEGKKRAYEEQKKKYQERANQLQDKRNQLMEDVKNYQIFLKQETYLSEQVMSSKWLQKQSLKLVESHSLYLKKNEDDTFTITPAGFEHLEALFHRALSDPLNNELLTQEDLVLLGHYFGRHSTKKVMDRYSLMGDGSDKLPFSLDNLRSLMVGAVVLQDPKSLQSLSDEHRKHLEGTYEKTLDAVTDVEKQGAALGRILDNFSNFEQNELAKDYSADRAKFFRAVGRGIIRGEKAGIDAYIDLVCQAGSANLISSPFTGDSTPITMVAGASGASALLGLLREDNPSAANFTNDLHYLVYAKRAKEEAEGKKVPAYEEPEQIAKKMLDVLEAEGADEKTVDDFLVTYPMFRAERALLVSFVKEQSGRPQVAALLERRIAQINDLGRAEQLAREHSLYRSKGDSTHEVMDRDGKKIVCHATTVTDTGIPGFRFNCFWPKELKNKDEPINLMIAIPEDIDLVAPNVLSPLARWASQYRAGHQKLEEGAISQADRMADDAHKRAERMDKQKFKSKWYGVSNESRREHAKRKIMEAINREIDRIYEAHPGPPLPKITIELFGHGVAASQAQQLELYILEALAARKQKDGGELPSFSGGSHGYGSDLQKALDEGVNEPMFNKEPNPAENLKPENIVGLRSYAFSGVGEPTRCAKKRAALIGYMASTEEGKEFTVEHNISTVQGDSAPYMGEDYADRYMDTNDPAFQNKGIKINHVTTETDQGLKRGGWFFQRVLKGTIDTRILHGFFGRFVGAGRFNNNVTFLSEGNEKLNHNLSEQCGRSDRKGMLNKFADNAGYAPRKALACAILYPAGKVFQSLKWACYSWAGDALLWLREHVVYEKIFSTKGVDADSGAQAKREKKHADEVYSELNTDKTRGYRERAEKIRSPKTQPDEPSNKRTSGPEGDGHNSCPPTL